MFELDPIKLQAYRDFEDNDAHSQDSLDLEFNEQETKRPPHPWLIEQLVALLTPYVFDSDLSSFMKNELLDLLESEYFLAAMNESLE